MRRVVKGAMAVGAALVIVGGAPVVAGASGGGGCGRPVSDARGATVAIKDFCFLPTILRVHPGQAVTFANRDGFSHVVLGANAVWGSFSQVRPHRHVTYRFTRPGVYPYVCTFHPGMVGAVVVGGGAGHGEATAAVTAAGPVVAVDHPAAGPRVIANDLTGTTPTPTDGWIAAWQIVGLTAFAGAVATFAALERRRSRRRGAWTRTAP